MVRTKKCRSLLNGSLSVLAAVALVACDDTRSPEMKPDHELSAAAEIHWFEGSVDAAFASAREEDKPLYLYWGAVWCPPCEEIKQTVFKSPAFIQQSRLFVPVYLDGDTPRAQTWGERFAVKGYPTMIVFNPSGEEITRIPGGIDVNLYAGVLGASLERLRSSEALIETALQNPDQLDSADYLQLAFYSWEQADLELEPAQVPDLLFQLANAADEKNALAAGRLSLLGLALHASPDKMQTSSANGRLQRRLAAVLDDERQVLANLDLLSFYCREILSAVTQAGPERQRLHEQWLAAMKRVRQQPQLSEAERLAAWYPAIHFNWLDEPSAAALPADLVDQLRAAVRRADAETAGSARQSVIHRASRVLQAAGLYQDSRALLAAEIERSDSPYYFMSSLAEVEEELGNHAAALDWLERAYRTSVGEATRFQWGVEYIGGLVRMGPPRDGRVIELANELLHGFTQSGEIFAGRNFGRLQLLLDTLARWHGASIEGGQGNWALLSQTPSTASILNELRQRCRGLERATRNYQNCSKLFAVEISKEA